MTLQSDGFDYNKRASGRPLACNTVCQPAVACLRYNLAALMHGKQAVILHTCPPVSLSRIDLRLAFYQTVMPERPPRTTQSIRRYYEQNTRLFFALGSSPATYSIHRALWMQGIETQDDALNASNRLLLAAAQGINASGCLRLLDLGCGIGGTLFYLLERLPEPALGVGLTISPSQARLAGRRAGQLGLDRSCLFVEADFLAPPLAVGFDLVYSVEAFVHAVDPQRYLAQAARLLHPGGRLILIDDFLAQRPVPEQQPARHRWLEAYRHGWHTPNLCAPAQVVDLALNQGLHLIQEIDLTPHLRLRALPAALASALLSLGERLPVRHAILPSMLGSMALQQCLLHGWISYRLLCFERGE